MSHDAKTLAVYDERAAEYAKLSTDPEQKTMLAGFISAMPKNARVLDYGCGPGHAAAQMHGHGLNVDAFDASPEMVRIAAQNEAVNVKLQSFDGLIATNIYHGVWASFSLLHAPKSEFLKYLSAIHRALVPGGLLTVGMKLGKGEIRDKIGRLYAYYSKSELEICLTNAGFTPAGFVLGESRGLSGEIAPFIVINAHA